MLGRELTTRLHRDKQYKRFFKAWGFEKNHKTDKMISMLKIEQKRLKEGKDTVFLNEKGEVIPKFKFSRFKNRHNITDFEDEELQEGTVLLPASCLWPSLMLRSRSAERHHVPHPPAERGENPPTTLSQN